VPGVATGGAVYVAVCPLAVLYGTIQPHPATVLLHFSVQVTPPGGRSFLTVALTGAEVPAVNAEGGSCEIAIVGATAIVVVAVAGFEGVVGGAAEEAIIVTTPPAGAVAGAV